MTQTARVSCSCSQSETRCRTETSCRQKALSPQWPRTRWERSASMVRITWGQYVAVCPPFTIHLSHTTNINPFENKVREIYFYKEVCSFFRWSSYIMFNFVSAYISICIWIRLYNIFMPLPGGLVQWERQIASSSIWNMDALSISYDHNHWIRSVLSEAPVSGGQRGLSTRQN